jgi:hypothetical protein
MDADIRIDGSGDRQFRKNFTTYLRKELNSIEKTIMKNCKLRPEKNPPGFSRILLPKAVK